MIVGITPFGAWVLPVMLFVLLFRRDWLPGVVVVCAVLQAPAPLIVTIDDAQFGVTPFHLAMAAAGLAMLADGWGASRSAWQRASVVASIPWAWYLAYAMVAALLLPFVFPDIAVHPLLAIGDVKPVPVPNTFSISHAAQAINHAGLLVLLAYLAGHASPKMVIRSMVIGFGAALAISLAAATYQRAVFLGWHSADFSFWASNPGYNQWFHSPEYGPVFGRVGLPFIEPSYASVWFAGVLGGLWMLVLYWRRRAIGWAILGATLAGLGLLNTVGTSGLLAMVVLVPLLVLRHALLPPARSLRSNLMIACMVAAALLVAGFAVADYLYLQTGLGKPLRSAIYFTLQKTSNLDARPRFFTTLHALRVFVDSYGIGIGPGSTRTSGFLVSVLAHLGLPGLVLLAGATVSSLRALEPAVAQPLSLFAVGMLYAGGIGVAIGIGDLAWPVTWIWVFFAVVVIRLPGCADERWPRGILKSRVRPVSSGASMDSRLS